MNIIYFLSSRATLMCLGNASMEYAVFGNDQQNGKRMKKNCRHKLTYFLFILNGFQSILDIYRCYEMLLNMNVCTSDVPRLLQMHDMFGERYNV